MVVGWPATATSRTTVNESVPIMKWRNASGAKLMGSALSLSTCTALQVRVLPQAQPARVSRAVQQRVPARLVFAVRGYLQEFGAPSLAVVLRVSE